MVRRKLVMGLLALSLGAPIAFAQQAPAAAGQAPANEVDPAAVQALKDMGAKLQSLKRFEVSIDLTGERVLTDGQKLQHTAAADLQVARPNMIRVKMTSARTQRELIFNGKTVTLFSPVQKYVSKVDFTGTIGDLTQQLKTKFGVELPASDLFLWGTAAAPLDDIKSAMNAGQDLIGNDLCDHYAFREEAIDWQIWISTASKLPRKLVITNRADDARPQSVTLMDWNLKPAFTDSTFNFVPPKGAKMVELVPLKTQ